MWIDWEKPGREGVKACFPKNDLDALPEHLRNKMKHETSSGSTLVWSELIEGTSSKLLSKPESVPESVAQHGRQWLSLFPVQLGGVPFSQAPRTGSKLGFDWNSLKDENTQVVELFP